MDYLGNWIQPGKHMENVCPVFRKTWTESKPVRRAVMYLTALGTYEATLNGQRGSDDVLVPGWIVNDKRLQVQCYEIAELLRQENCLEVTVGGAGSDP